MRRTKKAPIVDLARELKSPITIKTPNGLKKMSQQEAEIRALLEKALSGDMRAARKLLTDAIGFGLITKEEGEAQRPMSLHIPKRSDYSEWHKKFDELGFPPWPGEDDGLTDIQRPDWVRWKNAQR